MTLTPNEKEMLWLVRGTRQRTTLATEESQAALNSLTEKGLLTSRYSDYGGNVHHVTPDGDAVFKILYESDKRLDEVLAGIEKAREAKRLEQLQNETSDALRRIVTELVPLSTSQRSFIIEDLQNRWQKKETT